MKRLKIFTWHIHGSYLYYLTHASCDFYLPVTKERLYGYGGRTRSFPWGNNVHEVPVESVKKLELDIILFQSNYPSHKIYLKDQFHLFNENQLKLPKIYLEHEPPREHPTDTKHIVDDPGITLVHVTHFNNLMWDNNRTPTTVIEHGVKIPERIAYKGEIKKGLVVVNNIAKRGRRLGYDIFMKLHRLLPLDIAGIGSEVLGGLGEIQHDRLPEFMSHYSFLLNPIRYSSLGLTVCEAMMTGVPVLGLATTEMANVIKNGVNGYVDTDLEAIILQAQMIMHNDAYARLLSAGAKAYAKKRFSLDRFIHNWEALFQKVSGRKAAEEVINSGATPPLFA